MEKIIILQGARGMGNGERLKIAAELEATAASLAAAAARRLSALEGRPLSQATREDITGIFHSASIIAWMKTGEVVAPTALRHRGKCGSANPYSFATRLAWCREIRKADKSARSEVYRTLKTESETASMAGLLQWRDVTRGNWGEVTETVLHESASLAEASLSRMNRRLARRDLRHSRECLVVAWTMSGSRKANARLKSDQALLLNLTLCTRGKGFDGLNISGEVNASAARKAVERMRDRIAEGDRLLTEQPDEAEAALCTWKQQRQQGCRWNECRMAGIAE